MMTIRRGERTLAAAGIAIVALVALGGCRSVSLGLFETGRSALRAVAGVETGRVEAGEQSLGYWHREGAGPPIVLLHGFASEKDVWLRFLRALPRDREVLALDLPGHGDSSRDPDFRYDIPAIVGTVEVALATLSDEPVDLVGTSLGGMVAALYAQRNPARVITLALYAPAGVYPANPSEFQRALERGENPLIANAPREFDQLIDIVFYDPPPLVWPVNSALRQYAIERAPFHRKIWNDLWPGHPTLDLVLPAIDTPVLLVWGREDQVLDVSSVVVFERLLPNVHSVVIDDAGHAIINEKPRAMARLHTEFVSAQPCAAVAPASLRGCIRQARPARAAPASGE